MGKGRLKMTLVIQKNKESRVVRRKKAQIKQ